jgi:dUTPase
MAYLLNRENNTQPMTIINNPQFTLFICTQNCSEELQEIYKTNAMKHNDSVYHNIHPDSGFDILIPNEQYLFNNKSNKIDLSIKCEMVEHVNGTNIPSAFYMYPRSSISKTKFRLANNVGIIDSGYRGSLGAMIDVLYLDQTDVDQNGWPSVKCQKHTRLLQICTPILRPFKVVIVESDSELTTTSRGSGGFGSTGTGGTL